MEALFGMLFTKDTCFGAFLARDVLGDRAAVWGLEDASVSEAELILKDKRFRTRSGEGEQWMAAQGFPWA